MVNVYLYKYVWNTKKLNNNDTFLCVICLYVFFSFHFHPFFGRLFVRIASKYKTISIFFASFFYIYYTKWWKKIEHKKVLTFVEKMRRSSRKLKFLGKKVFRNCQWTNFFVWHSRKRLRQRTQERIHSSQ